MSVCNAAKKLPSATNSVIARATLYDTASLVPYNVDSLRKVEIVTGFSSMGGCAPQEAM